MINTLAPELRSRAARPAATRRSLPALRDGDPDRRARRAGHDPVRQRARHGGGRRIARGWQNWPAGCSSTSRSTSSSPPAPPALPKGATLTHHNILNNGYFLGEAMKLHRAGQGVHPGAAVPLLRHGDRQPGLHHAWRGDGAIPARASTRWPHCRPWRRSAAPALYGVPTMFIAQLDHPEFAQLRPDAACAPA